MGTLTPQFLPSLFLPLDSLLFSHLPASICFSSLLSFPIPEKIQFFSYLTCTYRLFSLHIQVLSSCLFPTYHLQHCFHKSVFGTKAQTQNNLNNFGQWKFSWILQLPLEGPKKKKKSNAKAAYAFLIFPLWKLISSTPCPIDPEFQNILHSWHSQNTTKICKNTRKFVELRALHEVNFSEERESQAELDQSHILLQ